MKHLKLLLMIGLFPGVVAFANDRNPMSEKSMDEMVPVGITEWQLNAPIGDQRALPPGDGDAPDGSSQPYHFPQWSSSFGITSSIYNKVRDYYNANWAKFSNRQYVVIIDMGLRSNVKRFVLFNLRTGGFERHVTAHGKGSDPDGDGWVNSFSNVSGSGKTSVGYYKTLSTYIGGHGRSLRLDGLSSTNSNALSRAIVVHGASYVNDATSYAGRSLGCPALANNVAQGVIDKIKGGALLVIASSRSL